MESNILMVILILIILLLWLKIRLMQKGAEEISSGLARKLACDTNTLLTISSTDRHMRKLAESINCQLREPAASGSGTSREIWKSQKPSPISPMTCVLP